MIEASILRRAATGSGAERWGKDACPASVAMCLDLPPEKTKKYTQDGTDAHSVARDILRGKKKLTSKTDEAVRTYVETIWEMVGKDDLVVEQRLPLLGSSGGLDCYKIVGRVAYLFDYKHGIGKRVRIVGNKQLLFYAACLKVMFPYVTSVYATLVQPRIENDLFDDVPHIGSWVIPFQSLHKAIKDFEEDLKEVEKAQQIKAGPWCQFCRFQPACPAHIGYIETIAAEQTDTPKELIPVPGQNYLVEVLPRVARIYLMKEQISSWMTKAEEFLTSIGIQSKEAEDQLNELGLILRRKRSNRKWKHEDPAGGTTELLVANTLKDRGIKKPYVKELMSITQAEKFCDVEDLVYKPEGTITVGPAEKGKAKRKLLPESK